MNIRDKILIEIYGKDYLEFYYIDSLLEVFNDGIPRTDLPTLTGDLGWTNSRITSYLCENNYLKSFGNGYIITAPGQMHLAKGGCRGEFIRHKLGRLSFILSIFATAVSIISFFIVIGK